MPEEGEWEAAPLKQSESQAELGNSFPELIANPPLENTSFVYSVPVKGEWKNGNMLRMLRGMFAQHIDRSEPFEVELIANVGTELDRLVAKGENDWEIKKNEGGEILLDLTEGDEKKKEALGILHEANEEVDYLRKLVEVQRLSRILSTNPKDADSRNKIEELIEGVSDPLQRKVIQLASQKADSISLAVIDATHTVFRETKYRYSHLSPLRTLGADVAKVRFEENPEVVLGLFDADTVPEGNNSVRDIQQIYHTFPGLNYVFTGMTNLPAGNSKGFVGDAPRENIRRTETYNSVSAHGSPQITFRLNAYNKLREISGWTRTGFHGDEDRDTSIRLIYHFGALQDGLLLESSFDLYSPTSMTSDRLDGTVDSAGRRGDYTKNGTRFVNADLGSVHSFKREIDRLIDEKPAEESQQLKDELEKARAHFEKRQKIQQRFNRLILNSLLDATDRGVIKVSEDQLILKDDEILQLPGGEALLHYLKANQDLIKDVINTPDDIQAAKYFLGKSETLPEGELTPFQLAIREYVGEVKPLTTLLENGEITMEEVKGERRSYWKANDHRSRQSRDSVMHSAVSETLALAHVYRKYFETTEFLESRKGSFAYQWPENRDEQDLEMEYGDQAERLGIIKEKMDLKTETKKDGNPPRKENILSRLRFRSVPLYELLRKLRK